MHFVYTSLENCIAEFGGLQKMAVLWLPYGFRKCKLGRFHSQCKLSLISPLSLLTVHPTAAPKPPIMDSRRDKPPSLKAELENRCMKP